MDSKIDEAWELIEKALNVRVAAETAILQQEINELRKYKKDIEGTFKRVMKELCPSDEVHCTCVPYLVQEVNRLKKLLRKENKI